VPDAAESARLPRRLKWTVKLRKDVKFHNIAPSTAG
jgi:ABC-type transport system substrate-binding protein